MSTAWLVGVWRDWAAERNSKATTAVSTKRTVSADILTNTNDELNKWLSKFVVEIRKKKNPESTTLQTVYISYNVVF